MHLGAPRFEPRVQVQKKAEPAPHMRFGFDSLAAPHPEPWVRFGFGMFENRTATSLIVIKTTVSNFTHSQWHWHRQTPTTTGIIVGAGFVAGRVRDSCDFLCLLTLGVLTRNFPGTSFGAIAGACLSFTMVRVSSLDGCTGSW